MATNRPNILLLITDQQNFNTLSCAGNRYCHTPWLDELARRGVRCAPAYAAAPVCGPSRAALASGLTPTQLNHPVNDLPIDWQTHRTFGHLLTDAGYDCRWLGKWHAPHFMPNRAKGHLVPGFQEFPIELVPGYSLGDTVDTQVAWMAREQFHKHLPTDQPWFMAAAFHQPHDICHWIVNPQPPYAHTEQFPPLPANFEPPCAEAEFFQRCRARKHYGGETTATAHWTETDWRAYLHAYYHMAEQVDRTIGYVLEALWRSKFADNTLVVFTSDHGENCGAHRMTVKLTLNEEAVRVPLLASWPGHLPAGAVRTDDLVSLLDLAPTFCDVAGARSPLELGSPGQSLLAHWQTGAALARDYIVSELAPDTEDLALQARMVRSRRYKYIACSWGARPEMLFDLQTDPGEMVNRAADPALRAELGAHRAHLRQWCERTGDPFTAAC